jgi:hypothetical protein
MRASVSSAAIARTSAAALIAATVLLAIVMAVPALHRPDIFSVLSDDDRRALGATTALRGVDPVTPDPAVGLTNPAAVARAYLAAAHSLLPGDVGHTQRRAAGFAQPGTPAAVGVVVLDPPPPGASRTAVVTALELVAAKGNRRGYRAEVRTATGRPGGPVTVARQHTLVVVSEGQDGRWRVVAETGDAGDVAFGED